MRGKALDTSSENKAAQRTRNPSATKEAILQATLSRLATSGPEGVSLVDIAQDAQVNRSTVYEHFKSRENLIDRTRAWISHKLYRAVFTNLARLGERPFESIDQIVLNDRLTRFAMDNPEACRVWLMQVISLADPNEDPFWAEYAGAMLHFSRTECAQDNVDPEVLAFIILSSVFLWPMFVRNRRRGARQLREEAHRYLHELMRMGLYGIIRPECFPEVVRQVEEWNAPSKPS
jgi:AcrR family transcriptional regulator